MKPFFSIIIPVYNVECFLEECVDSVLQQNMDNYEIILVDDGSTDSSGELCEKIKCSANAHIVVEHKKNGGQLSARLKGLEYSKGEYIVFLDSDDLLKSNALYTAEQLIHETNPDVLIYRWERIDQNGNKIDNSYSPMLFDEGFVKKSGSKITLLY